MSRYDILKHKPSGPTPEQRQEMQDQSDRLLTIEKFLTDQPAETIMDIGRILARDSTFLENSDPELFAKIRNKFGEGK